MSRYFIVLFLLTISFILVPRAFANAVQFHTGDIITGTNGGKLYHYDATGKLLDTLLTAETNNIATPLCFDPQGNVRVGNSVNNSISVFSSNGIFLHDLWGGPYNGLPTRCVTDNAGNFYVYTSEIFGTTNFIRKFTSEGDLVKTYAPEYESENTGTIFSKGLYSMSLSSDNCTMLYTSVQSLDATKGVIKQLNVCTDTQLPDFAEVPIPACTDIRIRSNGEVLVACGVTIYRLSNTGEIVSSYTPHDKNLLPESQVSYSIDLNPDGTTFLAGGNYSGNVYSITFQNGTGSNNAVFTVPTADPVWNTLVGLLAYGSASNPTVTPSPTSSPVPSPTPTVSTQQQPFLDLPWDYQGKRFETVALNPSSWFDHAYPLQHIACCVLKVLNYTGEEIQDYYRSHSGYDYPRPLGSAVLAAADGIATFEPETETAGGGNVIKIDHGNGYQTWYEHLSLNNIIVGKKNTSVVVSKGQKIGEVGMSGNTNGPHIHFSVFKDINANGSFSDDYPYGLVDPLGWEGLQADPWTTYGSGSKKGASSFPLFLARAKPKEVIVSHTATKIYPLDSTVTLTIPQDTLPIDFTIQFNAGPFIQNNSVTSSTPSFFLKAVDESNTQRIQFDKPIRITYSYLGADLRNIQESTLRLYYRNDETDTWNVLPSTVNTQTKTVTAETSHFSHFALMGTIKDATPPTTHVTITGQKGKEDIFRSAVTIFLTAKETNTSIGLDATVYKIDNEEWKTYTKPFTVSSEGSHTVSYLSIDKADNRETIQTKQFRIDTFAPEFEISVDSTKGSFRVDGKDPIILAVTEKRLPSRKYVFTTSDLVGNISSLIVEKEIIGKHGELRLTSLQYNSSSPLKLDKQIFTFDATFDRKKQLTELEQTLIFNQGKRISAIYVREDNTTTVSIKTKGNTLQTRKLSGLVLLRLFTQKGTLQYDL